MATQLEQHATNASSSAADLLVVSTAYTHQCAGHSVASGDYFVESHGLLCVKHIKFKQGKLTWVEMTVGGSWQGSPTNTAASQLHRSGMREAGSVACMCISFVTHSVGSSNKAHIVEKPVFSAAYTQGCKLSKQCN